MLIEQYQPTPEEIQSAEKMMTDEQYSDSLERQDAFDSLKPPDFDEKTGTILFTLDERLIYLEQIMSKAQAEGFVPKKEFHVTIIGFKNGKKIQKILKNLPPTEQQQKIEAINKLISSTDWSLASKPMTYKVHKDYENEWRETFIQTLDLREINNFITSLNQILDTDVIAQFPHLTLFTKGSDPETSKMGISINTGEEFKNLNPEIIETV